MINLLIADIHGENFKPILEKEKFDRVIFLGDYGHPKILAEAMSCGHPRKIVVGNHEYEHARGNKLHQYDKMPETWERYPDEREYILQKKMTFEEIINGMKIMYMHGTFVDNDYGPGCVWGRLREKKDIDENFRIMNEKNIWILFRGHDHCGDILVEKNDVVDRKFGNILFEPDKKYIVTVDNFGNENGLVGRYGIFDSAEMKYSARSLFDR